MKRRYFYAYLSLKSGESGIRTHGSFTASMLFKSIALVHYAISPYIIFYQKIEIESIVDIKLYICYTLDI